MKDNLRWRIVGKSPRGNPFEITVLAPDHRTAYDIGRQHGELSDIVLISTVAEQIEQQKKAMRAVRGHAG